MAGDVPVLDMSYVAGESLTGYQFRAVAMGNDGLMYLASTSQRNSVGPSSTATVPANRVWGILQNDPPVGDIAVVRELGHSKAVMLSTPAHGDGLKLGDTAGRLGTGTVGSDVIVAFMVDVSGGTGEIHEVAMMARTNASATVRARQLPYQIPIAKLATTGYVYQAMPLGFTGSVSDIYAVATSVCSASTSASAALTILLGSAGTTSIGTLSIPVTQLTKAHVESFGTVMTSDAGTITAGSFTPTNKISVYVTQGTTPFGGSDTGSITLYVEYN
jgi:hypothetical protein